MAEKPAEPTSALYLDGKKFETLHQEKLDDEQFHQEKRKDEHYAICDATRQKFLGDVIVKDGSAETIADEFLKFVPEKPGLDIEVVRILGSDSCPTMIGRLGGAIALIEQKSGAPCHTFVCLLHLAELPLRHFVRYYVGDTSGPRAFASELGKKISNLKKPKIIAYNKIPSPGFPVIEESVIKVERSILKETNLRK